MMGSWIHSKVVETAQITEKNRRIRLEMPADFQFIAGQYISIRLSSPDGYQAVRSYSILSSPSILPLLDLGVQVVPDGEVSSYLGRVAVGESLEILGPLGGHFIWDIPKERNVLLFAGGVGIVPLLSMIRFASENAHVGAVRLLYSARTVSELYFPEEIRGYGAKMEDFAARFYISREGPQAVSELNITTDLFYSRITPQDIKEVISGDSPLSNPLIYICGSSNYVIGIGEMVRDLEFGEIEVRTEGFG